MTTLTFDTNTIMAYVTESGDVGAASVNAALPDWEGSSVYFPRIGTDANCGLAKFNIDPDGSKTDEATIAALGVSGMQYSSGGAISLSGDGAHLLFLSTLTGPYNLARCSDLSFLATRTTSGTAPYNAVPLKGGGSDGFSFMAQGTTHIVRFMDQTGNSLGAMTDLATLTSGAVLYVSLGNHQPGTGVGYVINYTTVTTAAVNVYSFTTSGATLKGSFGPSNIDATWTNIVDLFGAAFDQTDGNLICGAYTTDAVTNKYYIFKVSATTGAVLWACPVGNIPPLSWAMARSRVKNGTYHFIGQGQTVHHIDTSDGSDVTETIDGFTGGGLSQYSDDVTNSIIFRGSFDQGVSPSNPCQYAGLYMNTEGHHTLSGQWARVWFASEPIPPPPGFPDINLLYTVPAAVGLPYCSHGQILRPDHGQDAGAANGPAFGKKRRASQFAANLYRTRGISFGMSFDAMRLVPIKTAGGTIIAAPTLYSGILDGTIEAPYDFDNKIAWKICRPYPATVLAIAGFLSTQDKQG